MKWILFEYKEPKIEQQCIVCAANPNDPNYTIWYGQYMGDKKFNVVALDDEGLQELNMRPICWMGWPKYWQ